MNITVSNQVLLALTDSLLRPGDTLDVTLKTAYLGTLEMHFVMFEANGKPTEVKDVEKGKQKAIGSRGPRGAYHRKSKANLEPGGSAPALQGSERTTG